MIDSQTGNKARQGGVSLVELMIALAIGLFLLLAVVQIFTTSRQSANSSMALGRVQESGRFALEMIKPSFRMTGLDSFCSLPVTPRVHLNSQAGTCANDINFIYNIDSAVLGWEFLGTGPGDAFLFNGNALDPAGQNPNLWASMNGLDPAEPLPAALQNQVVPGTDVLLIRRVEPIADRTAEPGTPATLPTTNFINVTDLAGTPAASGLQQFAVGLVTDCSFADLFQNTADATETVVARVGGGGGCANPGNTGANWSTPANNSVQLFRFVIEAFYIGLDAASGEPGLYRMDLSQGIPNPIVGEPLVDGIESMQLRFGLSRARGQEVDDGWGAAHQVPDWPRVVAVRISLLARSQDLADTTVVGDTFNLAGAAITHTPDSRLRKPFAATVMLRNRLIVQ